MGIVRLESGAFVRDGKAFIPWGANHFVPGTGWPPQLWKTFEPARAREDFARMRDLGVNVVRVFGTWMSFVESETRVNEEGFDKFEQMLDIAWENDILLHPTGPDHWEGFPAFMGGETNYVMSERLLRAAENYWREMGRRFKDDERIFAYDLLNEPSVHPDDRFWAEWQKIAEPRQDPVRWPVVIYHRASARPCDEAIVELERLRNRFGDAWVSRMTEAIRSTGTSTLVTCGFLQHVFPLAGNSCGFHLSGAARPLDFVSIHYYPGNIGFSTDYRRAVDVAALWASYAASYGKPMIFGEFGWLGGNTRPMVSTGQVQYPTSTEEQSSMWCRDLVVNTQPYAQGWLCWGSYDVPESLDCTRHSGLMDAEGRVKEWGRMFKALGSCAATTHPVAGLPVQTFDRIAILTGKRYHADEMDRLIFLRRSSGDFSLHEA